MNLGLFQKFQIYHYVEKEIGMYSVIVCNNKEREKRRGRKDIYPSMKKKETRSVYNLEYSYGGKHF